MKILNFSHPLTDVNLSEIALLTGVEVEEKRIDVQIDFTQSFHEQVVRIVDACEFSPLQWQAEQFIVNLPGLAALIALLIAEIHGRSGHFPAILGIRRDGNRFTVAEIISLADVRNEARSRRFNS